MQIALAPMEGLVDDILRDVLTGVGGVDWCVTEFIRVSDRLLPASSFHRLAPELQRGAATRAGTPLRVQLLGSDPLCLADNAAYACSLGAPAIDLNFGCPAKTVNKSRGGAILLNEPDLLHSILHEVRKAVPGPIPVTANDYDPDGEAIALIRVGTPRSGKVEISTASVVLYQPNPGFVGVDEFRYELADGGGVAFAAVRIIVISPPPPNLHESPNQKSRP